MSQRSLRHCAKTYNRTQQEHDSPLKISSDSATSSSQDRHRLGVSGERKGNLTLPIEFQSHGKVVGPQLTQSLVDEEEKRERNGTERRERNGSFQTGRCRVATRSTCKMEQVKLFSYSVFQRAEFNWCHQEAGRVGGEGAWTSGWKREDRQIGVR